LPRRGIPLAVGPTSNQSGKGATRAPTGTQNGGYEQHPLASFRRGLPVTLSSGRSACLKRPVNDEYVHAQSQGLKLRELVRIAEEVSTTDVLPERKRAALLDEFHPHPAALGLV